jgi:hypothetical protein
MHHQLATQASTETVPGIPVYNRLFAERLHDFSAPLTPTNVTLERIEPPTADTTMTDTLGDTVRLPGSNAPPNTVKGNNMAVVLTPPPLSRDERVRIATFVLNHAPIAVVELLLERARETRNISNVDHDTSARAGPSRKHYCDDDNASDIQRRPIAKNSTPYKPST